MASWRFRVGAGQPSVSAGVEVRELGAPEGLRWAHAPLVAPGPAKGKQDRRGGSLMAVVTTFGSVMSKGTATKEGASRGGRKGAAVDKGMPGAPVGH